MGISFDLSVEDLPDGIFDAIVAAGYHKQDPYTIGRWDGIIPTPGSWIVNDIQVANNTVLICGSYVADWRLERADQTAGAIIPGEQTYMPFEMIQGRQIWRDGFFAAVSFDWIDKLEAWHLVCTRSALELGPAIGGLVDPTLQEGGLYSMVIDQRTFSTPEFYNSSRMYITAVGYTAVKGLDISGYDYFGQPPPLDELAYAPYQYSVFENQDYYPQIFSFLVDAQESTINDFGDTWTPTGRINPFIDPRTGQPIQSNTEPLRFQGVTDYIQQFDEVDNPGDPKDQLGQTIHLEMYDFTATDAGSPIGFGISSFDWLGNYYYWYDVAFSPLEQYTYRGHQIGYNQLPYSQVRITAPYGRVPLGFFYCPTPTVSMAPIIKPIEFTMAVPGYQVYTQNEPTQYPYHPENIRETTPPFQPKMDSDAHIWRHGFIPRKLKTIYRTTAVFGDSDGLTFPIGNNLDPDALGTLVIGGECLVQDYDSRNEPIAGQAKSTGGVLNYEPLLLYGQNGVALNKTINTNLTDIGVFFAFTKRNFCIEDVTATGTVNSSLDNASIEVIAPCLDISASFTNNYAVVLCVQITDPEPRAEIMIFEAKLADCASYPFNYVQDYKVVGPYASKGGVWETATGIELGTTWHNVGAQPDPFTEYQLSLPSNIENIKTYSNKDLDPYDNTGAPTGRSIILGGNTTRRTPNGTWAVAYDTGSVNADYSISFNTRSPPTPTIPNGIGFAVLKVSRYTDSQPAYAPQELDYYDRLTNTQLFQQTYQSRLYHIPNTNIQYPINTFPPIGWEWRTPSSNQLLINGYGFGLLYPGATIAPPSGRYFTLSDLAQQLNDELEYIKSDLTTEAYRETPTGLKGIMFKVTSDNKGVYAETDSQYFETFATGQIIDPTAYEGVLILEDPTGTWNNQDNYPYANDPSGPGSYIYPWDLVENPMASTVESLRGQDFSGCFLDIGELLDNSLNPPKPITIGSERFFMSADYDNDRDQWLISLTDITEKFTVLAATTDFSEILDQTASIEQKPANRNEALLLALNQKTNALDGVAFAGDYVPIHGVTNDKAYKITGTTGRTVKVFLNYMLYDGLDSMIAVELSNLGLGVTPENVLWYKTTILNANADQEVTLEEIESWMDLQRQQYQEMLKNRKPIQRDTGSDPKVDDYILDDKSIADLLPELDRLPPNPDSNPTDADMMGNTLSGDIQSVEEKRRESDV
jgi:hypothetical protein